MMLHQEFSVSPTLNAVIPQADIVRTNFRPGLVGKAFRNGLIVDLSTPSSLYSHSKKYKVFCSQSFVVRYLSELAAIVKSVCRSYSFTPSLKGPGFLSLANVIYL